MFACMLGAHLFSRVHGVLEGGSGLLVDRILALKINP